jgi:NAD-dependent dihydropyrimidine dehydrogenase PreA subunit
MPGLFIDIQIDAEVAKDPEIAAKLAEVCPVNIFEVGADSDSPGVTIVEKELDECVLCDLCLEVAPGKIQIIKLYEQD